MKARRAVVVAVVLAAVVSGVLVIVFRSPRVDAELRDPNPAVRAAAVRRLNVDSDADRLLSSLKDDDSDVRLLSAMRLGARPSGKPGIGAERKAPALIEALKDRHAGVRRAAAESLGELWPATEKALTEALTDSDPRVRAGAAFALSWAPNGMSGREVTAAQAEPLLPLLHDLLNDEDSEVRQNAARALEQIR
ncbi:MAG TPA: HEAT repeat domain-containing protein [Gemmataceae bacterium]|nr:HEAT repeat domain-containing protein [Gemmataceae bacterium]